MMLAHKIALDPTIKQKHYFQRAVGTARFVWNWALGTWKALYEKGEKPNALNLKKLWNTCKREEFPWVYEVAKDVNQHPFANLQNAFSRFFKGEAAYPQFKKKGRHDSFYVSNDKLKLAGMRVYLPRLGWVKMREELRFVGKIKGATVSREADRWFIAFQVDIGDSHRERSGKGIIGVDLGIKSLATLSTGEQIPGPKPLAQAQKQLRRANRTLHRRQKGSANRKKAGRQVARRHCRVKNIRQDALHKVSHRLIRENQAVSIEDLHVKGMVKNRHLSRAISDMGWGELRRQLTYKAVLFGTVLTVIGRWEPTSKTCSQCGVMKQALTLSERVFRCLACGFREDRDVNAAVNIQKLGQAMPEVTPVEIPLAAESRFPRESTSHVSLKQELHRVHL